MHRVVNATTAGSVGDLGRIARRLATDGINIAAVGGGEGSARGGSVGHIAFLIDADDGRTDEEILDKLIGLPLSSTQEFAQRTLDSVEIFQAIDIELDDKIGELAAVGEVLGAALIDIKAALSVDVHADWGILALAFADDDVDQARDLLSNAQDEQGNLRFKVYPEHGARKRRRRVDNAIKGKVGKGDD